MRSCQKLCTKLCSHFNSHLSTRVYKKITIDLFLWLKNTTDRAILLIHQNSTRDELAAEIVVDENPLADVQWEIAHFFLLNFPLIRLFRSRIGQMIVKHWGLLWEGKFPIAEKKMFLPTLIFKHSKFLVQQHTADAVRGKQTETDVKRIFQ